MDPFDKILIGICISATIIFTSWICLDHYKDIEMAKLGYEQAMDVGRGYPMWKKVR